MLDLRPFPQQDKHAKVTEENTVRPAKTAPIAAKVEWFWIAFGNDRAQEGVSSWETLPNPATVRGMRVVEPRSGGAIGEVEAGKACEGAASAAAGAGGAPVVVVVFEGAVVVALAVAVASETAAVVSFAAGLVVVVALVLLDSMVLESVFAMAFEEASAAVEVGEVGATGGVTVVVDVTVVVLNKSRQRSLWTPDSHKQVAHDDQSW